MTESASESSTQQHAPQLVVDPVEGGELLLDCLCEFEHQSGKWKSGNRHLNVEIWTQTLSNIED